MGMARHLVPALFLALGAAGSLAQTLAIQAGRLVDVENGIVLQDQVILVEKAHDGQAALQRDYRRTAADAEDPVLNDALDRMKTVGGGSDSDDHVLACLLQDGQGTVKIGDFQIFGSED